MAWWQWLVVALALIILSWVVMIALAKRLPPGLVKDLATVLPACVTTARRLRRDSRVPRRVKLAVALAGLWVLSPIDLIPEFLPVIGPLDDVVVVALALRYASRRIPPEALVDAWPAERRILTRLAPTTAAVSAGPSLTPIGRGADRWSHRRRRGYQACMGSTNSSGGFDRDTNYVTTRITRDGREGFAVEAGRYRLIAARACPWANRALIVRRLLGLEQAISLGLCGPEHDQRSWTFDLDPGGRDPVLGYQRLAAAYFARDPDYDRGITVPAMVDVTTGAVVTNDFAQMTLDLSTEWTEHHRAGAPELYPDRLRDEIDSVAGLVYRDVNNGVYQCGFAEGQAAYEEAFANLFARLDWLEERLQRQRFLVGDTITEADVRLFTTLARFDAVYHGHFKCNRQKLTEFPALWAYARDLFQTPGFGDTVDFAQIKQHYYRVHRQVNPTGIVPAGPDLGGWMAAHDREQLGGRPFGDGTPPPPPSIAEQVDPQHTPLPVAITAP